MKKLLCLMVCVAILGLTACVPPPHDGHGSRPRRAEPTHTVRESEHKPAMDNHQDHRGSQAKSHKPESYHPEQGGPGEKNQEPNGQPRH